MFLRNPSSTTPHALKLHHPVQANTLHFNQSLKHTYTLGNRWCYTQLALWPYIDSEINHIRHFIKIQFVNIGIKFINLPSILKDKSVISSIPTYFENKESSIICYTINNKPIHSTAFNYNK